MKPIIYFSLSFFLIFCSSVPDQQKKQIPNEPRLIGTCEGCEAIFEYGDKPLLPVDTLPDFHEEGMKVKVTGTIYEPDGQTPAEGVILYLYHTNQKGIYENRFEKKNWERRHGYIRGWVKTGKDGRYEFFTLKPGIYPDRNNPAHIHPTILEPNGKYYWLEDYYFSGDSLLTKREISPSNPHGGSAGVLKLTKEGDIWVGERDFVLGKNVSGYE